MTNATWADNEVCPFCETELPDPGAGFIDHIDESAECQAGFDDWRTNVAGDIRGGWIA